MNEKKHGTDGALMMIAALTASVLAVASLLLIQTISALPGMAWSLRSFLGS